MSAFFLIAPPGLEDVCERELRAWLPLVSAADALTIAATIKRVRGGVSFGAPVAAGFELNHVLKTPSRLLLRVSDFRCRDFPKLFKKARNLGWGDWDFPRSPTPDVSASVQASRVKMKRRIEETCADGFRAWRKAVGRDFEESAEPRPTLMVRFDNDVCAFSLDTSGEHLHKRGYRVDTPEAPVRETLAAALLLKLLEAQDSTPWVLVDPMAGSGTFLLEAGQLGARHARGYAYENFAAVREGRIAKLTPTSRRPESLPRFSALIGIDSSPDVHRAARANAERAPSEMKPEYILGDTLQDAPAGLPRHAALICNPPYGERLKVEGALTAFYTRMVAAFEDRFAPSRAGLLLPAKADPRRIGWPKTWRRVSETAFSNGGIPVVFHIFARDSGLSPHAR